MKNLTIFLFWISIVPFKTQAFDPTSLLTATQSLSGVLGGLDKVDEMADLGFALTDLLSELGVETESEADIDRAAKKLEDLNSRARDLKWTHQEIKQALESDLRQTGSLKEKLRGLRTMISASKRIAEIMGVRPKAAERASQIQSIRINSMILEELQAQRRQEYLAYLEKKEAQTKRDLFLAEIQDKERGKNLWRQE